ncbi:DEAD/DEAH box helicase family protein [uncultured Microscilla sp.]|uniref:type I restriction endonuclease subunit R n=1 Tax=uncultured Microscilla sp. TaxID=432653 RepID=UPI002615F945|nr:DEAD/DEAH box helicase family protein [uncultured Microscilla sp.]
MANTNQHPEQIARDKIDQLLEQAGWAVQAKNKVNLNASQGVAVREYQTDVGPADYVLFVKRKPVGIIEAKREEEGHHLTMVEEQSTQYAHAKLKHLNHDPLPFVYESTGTLTRFTNYHDPKPRGRRVFGFYTPQTLAQWLEDYRKTGKTLRGNLLDMPALDTTGLRPAQIVAINNLETSFKENRPKALIQMATGAGKTFTAATFIYRLLKHANAQRVLFLVDTKNLGEQAEQEFMKFQPRDDNRKFTELYNVQRLSSSHIAPDNQVYISTIQRLYSILKGQELDESAELDHPNESTWLQNQLQNKAPMPVVYNPKLPLEMFDFIVVDECHRSIYNLWKQVLDYFDAFLVGLTATPDKRTFGFFNENVVSEYSYEESVTDGVNVPYDVYLIETEISQKGATIEAGWQVDRRDKLTRRTRWQQEDEDTIYTKNNLDKKVVNPSQIRHIIREFKNALQKDIFPNRYDDQGEYQVPKTLIFAKTDSHADDIIKMVREEFGEGNDFCKKVTYKAQEDPKSVLNRFRNNYYPRIAVTVDMIATGTDVKPLEVLLFMRDVKSRNYFEQMKGRGTRTVGDDALKQVSSAAQHKTHFVIVDAVGATKSKKTDSRPLERKRSVATKDLLGAVAMGASDEDLFLSLANRLIRLNRQLSPTEAEGVLEHSGGKSLPQMTKELLAAYDPDTIDTAAQALMQSQGLPSLEMAREQAQAQLIETAAITFNGELNEYLENVRREHEQIIDHINLDQVTKAEWDTSSTDRAQAMVQDFSQYMADHKDEIKALSIYYDQPHQRRHVTEKMVKEVLAALKADKPTLAPLAVWEAYTALEKVKGSRPEKELTALVALLRRITGLDSVLTAYDKTVDRNFQDWVFKRHSGASPKFNDEQMQWLRMLKNHVATSLYVDLGDLDYSPFDSKGGRRKMEKLFGNEIHAIIEELNEVLVA